MIQSLFEWSWSPKGVILLCELSVLRLTKRFSQKLCLVETMSFHPQSVCLMDCSQWMRAYLKIDHILMHTIANFPKCKTKMCHRETKIICSFLLSWANLLLCSISSYHIERSLSCLGCSSREAAKIIVCK